MLFFPHYFQIKKSKNGSAQAYGQRQYHHGHGKGTWRVFGGLLPPGAIYGCFSQRNLWMLSTSLYWQYFGTTNDVPPLN